MKNVKTYYSEVAKTKAAYVLNLCSVSVSQIVDYHDIYILEQEYNAILNNLNLKQIPKDESLLNILREILNTITFFRIQQIRKEQIEKKYQRNIRNAIWSSIPSINILVAGDPYLLALSLATTIGSAYMNYRKEKANAAASKDNELVELEITAIEQLNALRRELFTTAWRLADEYDFDDELRLTENQIRQYNNILMDNNKTRKFSRMEAIADKFKAYPPFWYNYGHVANEIANDYKMKLDSLKGRNEQDDLTKYESIKNYYINKAKDSFSKFFELNDISILREDIMAASCALEFAEILLLEKNHDKEAVVELIQKAEKNAFNAFDILQICAINYYRINEKKKAARILKRLVIEEYNKTANIKLLSAIYVKLYFEHDLKLDINEDVLTNYELLKVIVGENNESFLLPIPQSITTEKCVDLAEEEYFRKYSILYKKVLRRCFVSITQNYYNKCSSIAENLWLDFSRNENGYIKNGSSILKSYIALVNTIITSFMKINFIRDNNIMEDIVKYSILRLKEINKIIKDSGNNNSQNMTDIQLELNNLINRIKLNFLDKIHAKIFSIEDLLKFEIDLEDFCISNSLPLPMDINTYSKDSDNNISEYYISYDMVEDNKDRQAANKRNERVKDLLYKKSREIIIGRSAELILDERNIELFKSNKALEGDKNLLSNLLCIIKDSSSNNHHLVILPNGLVFIKDNKISSKIMFSDIYYIENQKQGIKYRDENRWLGFKDVEYYNDGVDIPVFMDVIKDLADIDRMYKNRIFGDPQLVYVLQKYF